MTIVFGAGKEAETYIREFSGTDEIVCYDNDRRKERIWKRLRNKKER